MGELTAMQRRVLASRRLLAIIEDCLGRNQGHGERLLKVAGMAGKASWSCHAGTFALPLVERALREAPHLVGRAACAGEAARVRGRTLHVLTEAYPLGGHTRLVKRWIECMDGEAHAVTLVRQRHPADPSWLMPAGRDVPLVDLGRFHRGPDKVACLMALFDAAARVVLHVHPDDACSVAAAYRSPAADIRFLNHADHVAWLGAGLPVPLLNLRQRGTRLAADRRGIDEANCDVVPIPIAPPPRLDRREARRQLGLGDDEILMLTVASAAKYLPVEGWSLLPILRRILARPELRLVAIGPGAGHPVFGPLLQDHPGRAQALGVIQDPIAYRAAADLYLDSYPLGSLTSMLESAALGTPIAAFQPDLEELGILYTEPPGLAWSDYAARETEPFLALVDALVEDPALRQRRAEGLRSGIAGHFPDGWRQRLAAHLARPILPRPWKPERVPVLDGPLDRILAAVGADPCRQDRLLRRRNGMDFQGRLRYRWERLMERIGRT